MHIWMFNIMYCVLNNYKCLMNITAHFVFIYCYCGGYECTYLYMYMVCCYFKYRCIYI